MSDYNSEYTGAQIDEAVRKSLADIEDPLSRSGGTMTGDLVISKSVPALKLVSTTGGRTAHFWVSSDDNVYMRNSLDDNNRSALYLQPETIADFGRVLRLQKMVDGTATYYSIFGEHNKPDGSYTGNGSSTSRTIDTGGSGNVLLICGGGTGYMALVTPAGCIFKKGTTLSGASTGVATFEDGVLTIKSTDACLNTSSKTYTYYVL